MRPQHFAAEYRIAKTLSFSPRRGFNEAAAFRCGIRRSRAPPRCAWRCFNEAAAFRCGIRIGLTPIGIQEEELQ